LSSFAKRPKTWESAALRSTSNIVATAGILAAFRTNTLPEFKDSRRVGSKLMKLSPNFLQNTPQDDVNFERAVAC